VTTNKFRNSGVSSCMKEPKRCTEKICVD
jgi:hypothetical protein